MEVNGINIGLQVMGYIPGVSIISGAIQAYIYYNKSNELQAQLNLQNQAVNVDAIAQDKLNNLQSQIDSCNKLWKWSLAEMIPVVNVIVAICKSLLLVELWGFKNEGNLEDKNNVEGGKSNAGKNNDPSADFQSFLESKSNLTENDLVYINEQKKYQEIFELSQKLGIKEYEFHAIFNNINSIFNIRNKSIDEMTTHEILTETITYISQNPNLKPKDMFDFSRTQILLSSIAVDGGFDKLSKDENLKLTDALIYLKELNYPTTIKNDGRTYHSILEKVLIALRKEENKNISTTEELLKLLITELKLLVKEADVQIGVQADLNETSKVQSFKNNKKLYEFMIREFEQIDFNNEILSQHHLEVSQVSNNFYNSLTVLKNLSLLNQNLFIENALKANPDDLSLTSFVDKVILETSQNIDDHHKAFLYASLLSVKHEFNFDFYELSNYITSPIAGKIYQLPIELETKKSIIRRMVENYIQHPELKDYSSFVGFKIAVDSFQKMNENSEFFVTNDIKNEFNMWMEHWSSTELDDKGRNFIDQFLKDQ